MLLYVWESVVLVFLLVFPLQISSQEHSGNTTGTVIV